MGATLNIPKGFNKCKYLGQYTDEAISKALDDHGAFFCFNNKQFEESRVEGVKYCNLGAGLIGPTDKAKKILDAVETATDQGIAQDLKENGKRVIIWRELANHEAQIGMDTEDTERALEFYPITKAEIRKEWPEYMDYCRKYDLF